MQLSRFHAEAAGSCLTDLSCETACSTEERLFLARPGWPGLHSAKCHKCQERSLAMSRKAGSSDRTLQGLHPREA